MLLKPSPVSSDRFTWNPASQTFAAEMSDLPALGRVYDDACDVGLTLVSTRTGSEVVCAVEHEHRDVEGDLLYIDLLPVPESPGAHGPGFRVRLFND